MNVMLLTHVPLVAGVEYFSGLDPGWGYRFNEAIGKPLEISGFTTTASPVQVVHLNFQDEHCMGRERRHLRNFFQNPFGLR